MSERLKTLASGAAWRAMAETVCVAVGDTLGVPTRKGDASVASALAHASTITLVDASKGVELLLGVAAPRDCLAVMSAAMFGEALDEPEALADMVREIANCVMGRVKGAMIAEGLELTMGLPVPQTEPEFKGFWSKLDAHLDASLEVEGRPLVVHAALRGNARVEIPARSLAEPMVLADDLLNERGVLLLARGTRVTTTQIERVLRHVRHERLVCVCGG